MLDEFMDAVPWARMSIVDGAIEDEAGNCPIISVALVGAKGRHNFRALSIGEHSLGVTRRHCNSIIAAADNVCLGSAQKALRRQMLRRIRSAHRRIS